MVQLTPATIALVQKRYKELSKEGQIGRVISVNLNVLSVTVENKISDLETIQNSDGM